MVTVEAKSSKCDSWTNNIGITWMLFRMQILKAHLDLMNQNLRVGPNNLGLMSPPGDSAEGMCLRTVVSVRSVLVEGHFPAWYEAQKGLIRPAGRM